MRFISADFIFDGTRFLPERPVLVLDDNNCFIEYVGRNTIHSDKIEDYKGIICPGFVNAHCHLELSHMKGLIPEGMGLLNFAKNIISKRRTFSPEQIKEAMEVYDKKMWENGIVAVGDISNTEDTFETKQKSPIFYHTFLELIAFDPTQANTVFSSGKELQKRAEVKDLKNSLVPHAPYSVSSSLMKMIAEDVAETGNAVSIHNQETKDENLFFEKKEGVFAELYEFLKMPIDHFKVSGKTSLQTYLPHLDKCRNLILVHNTFTPEEDLQWANAFHKELYWCLCPNANLYIENTLPELKTFLNHNCKMVIGTDSLASNHSLSITDEINVLLKHFKWLSIEETLKWATSNGAEALGIEANFGKFVKGKKAGLNLLSYTKDTLSLEKKLA
jgi:cytosine/adenosine deaminase-related metal-dependent hydrolase